MRFLPRIHFCWMTVLQQSRKKGSLVYLQEFLFNLWSESQWSSAFPPVYVMGFGSCEITVRGEGGEQDLFTTAG